MKVYEIIAEQRNLNEGFWSELGDKALGVFGRGEAGAAKLSLKAFLEKTSNDVAQQAVAKGVTPSKIIADKVANIANDEARIQQEIERVAKKNGTTMTKGQAIDYINARAKKKKEPLLATEKDVLLDERWQDPNFQDQIKQAANARLRTNNYGPNATNVGAGTGGKIASKTGNWIKSAATVQGVLTGLNLYEFYQPYHEFTTYMDSAAEHRKDNSWTPEQYQAMLNKQTMVLVTKWAELIVVPGIMKKLFGLTARLVTINQSSKFIQWLAKKYPGKLNALDGMTDIALKQWVNDSGRAKWIAVGLGSFLGEYVPGLAEIFETALSFGGINPVFPSDPKPADSNTAASPNGTTTNSQAAVNATSTDSASGGQYQGMWHIDPLTGKDAQGRQFYDKNPNARNNWDITDWVTGPNNNFIQNPKNPTEFLAKPAWWHVDPAFLTKDQLRLKSPGDD
jgi:hypothetical protein